MSVCVHLCARFRVEVLSTPKVMWAELEEFHFGKTLALGTCSCLALRRAGQVGLLRNRDSLRGVPSTLITLLPVSGRPQSAIWLFGCSAVRLVFIVVVGSQLD